MRKCNLLQIITIILLPLQILGNELLHGPYMQDVKTTEITILWEIKSSTVGKIVQRGGGWGVDLRISDWKKVLK